MTDNPAASVIEVENLRFGFNQTPVLDAINFQITQGAFSVIVGPNGGGKTTLLHLILGLYRPDQGRIQVFSEKPGRHPERIGYVPQHSNLAPGFPATVEQVVLMGLPHGRRHGPLFWKDERQRAHQAMQHAGVADLARRPYADLSGGQRQRVLIARALITDPDLLILDEPFSNVDPYGRQCILETLTGLNEQLTCLMVSHDLGITREAVTQVIAINRYAISQSGAQITDAMLGLMYGWHDENCPMHQDPVTVSHNESIIKPVRQANGTNKHEVSRHG